MPFEFATAGRILFGTGTRHKVAEHAREYGMQAILVTGRDTSRCAEIRDEVKSVGVTCEVFPVSGEPTVDLVAEGASLGRRQGAELVIAVGGGSALDAGKAIAALLTNTGEVSTYLEVIGEGKPLEQAAAPCIAVPTTAGTGAEVTRNAVIASKKHKRKVSMRHVSMLPRVAIVDPELTHGMSPELTAATGLDALTQLIEAFVTPFCQPMTDGFCREGIRRAAWALPQAFEDGTDVEAREGMACASLLGGLALANAKLGVVHGVAGPLGGMFDAPHGAVCGRLLGPVMRTNVVALMERDADNPALGRYAEVATMLGESPDPEAGAGWVETLCARMDVPGLGTYGMGADGIAEVVAQSAASSSMKGNPVKLTDAEITRILQSSL